MIPFWDNDCIYGVFMVDPDKVKLTSPHPKSSANKNTITKLLEYDISIVNIQSISDII